MSKEGGGERREEEGGGRKGQRTERVNLNLKLSYFSPLGAFFLKNPLSPGPLYLQAEPQAVIFHLRVKIENRVQPHLTTQPRKKEPLQCVNCA